MNEEVDFQVTGGNKDRAEKQVLPASGFNYGAPAELFSSRSKKLRGSVSYKRFQTAAEALRFAIEKLPGVALIGTYLEVDEIRFGQKEIRYLYAEPAYPLTRGAASA